MNREIKFRAWDKKSKIMLPRGVYNYSFNVKEFGVWVYSMSNTLTSEKMKDFIYLQYTGLKDSKGKEIYEGDIVKRKDKVKGKVFFREGCFMVNFTPRILNYQNNVLEVIGNIYENKDLL